MDDHLALLVGRVILQWGRLDQYLHIMLIGFENATGTPHQKEGRFSERRKLFRRHCVRLTADDPAFMSECDKALSDLVLLERKRGRIAHGISGGTPNLTMFLHFPSAFEGADIDADLKESSFTYPALETLASDIEASSKQLLSVALEALAIGKQAGRTVPRQ